MKLSEEGLKPCPFCGSDDIDESFSLQNNGYMGTGCMTCGASTECKEDKQEAAKTWNTRVLSKPVERIMATEFKLIYTDIKGRKKTISQPLLDGFTFDIEISNQKEK